MSEEQALYIWTEDARQLSLRAELVPGKIPPAMLKELQQAAEGLRESSELCRHNWELQAIAQGVYEKCRAQIKNHGIDIPHFREDMEQ